MDRQYQISKYSGHANWAIGLAIAVLVGGCALVPKPATRDEVISRVKEDTASMYVGQEPLAGPLTFEEAVARTLKYNLDLRLKKMESALALGVADQATFDMLPSLVASAGYRSRNNDSGGTSIGIVDHAVSLRPSTSEERTHGLTGAEFSWNALDFGVSYFRARQQADSVLVAEERRRKVVQNLVQDVRTAYWRALGAQRLMVESAAISERAEAALVRSREAEKQRLISPAQALTYQRALLDAISQLNVRRQDLEYAKRELAALMNVEPGANIVLAETAEAPLPPVPKDIGKLEEMALMQRPELREEDFRKRITADETRKQLLSFLPGLNLDFGVQHDTNAYLYSNSWSEGGVRLSWNLLKLFSLPAIQRNQYQQEQVDKVRRMALSMAVMTQVRIGVERYRLALEDYRLSDVGAQVDKRLADYTQAAVSSRLEGELEAIRTRARAVLGAYQRMSAYGQAQVAFARVYNSIGIDALPDNVESVDLPTLTESVRAHLQAVQNESLPLTSNLFSPVAGVSVRINGVGDPQTLAHMTTTVGEILARNAMVVREGGVPLTLSLDRSEADGMEKVRWSIEACDANGKVLGEAVHASTLPANPRQSAYEATLAAAVTSKLPQLRVWMSQSAQ